MTQTETLFEMPTEYAVEAPSPRRLALWRCRTKGCGWAHAVDMERHPQWVTVYGGGREQREVWCLPVTIRRALPDGAGGWLDPAVHGWDEPETQWVAPGSDRARRAVPSECPECGGHRFDGGPVDGHLSDGVKCDARCQFARRNDCECSCGGANHGRGWVQ